MKALICEICGSNEMVKDGDFFVCQYCGTRYTLESARKMFAEISGTPDFRSRFQIKRPLSC